MARAPIEGEDFSEHVPEPNALDDLLEKIKTDPGAPFAPEVIAALVELKTKNYSEFAAMRARLKRASCSVTALDRAVADGADAKSPTQSDRLIKIAESANLFHTPDGTGYADIEVNGHRETWPLKSKGFKGWLARSLYLADAKTANADAFASALTLIEAKAQFDGPEFPVYTRIGELNGKIYLNLADESWRAVEIDAEGWRVIDKPPVKFRRPSGMKELPEPTRQGSIEVLRRFLNIKSDTDFVLVVSFLLAAMRACGPYPLLALSGEQGSAKSMLTELLRTVIDPNTTPLRSLPRENRDLFIAATNNHVISFDNLSELSPWISDTLCRLATGGGFAVRSLYTDQDEVIFNACRPIMMNGIEEVIERPDLADRALYINLEPIPENLRRTEKEILSDFSNDHPKILGALLDAVSVGIYRLPNTKLTKLPRMADFALWVTACEPALWPKGTFADAYKTNCDNIASNVLGADPVATAVRSMMDVRVAWKGTATTLLDDLSEYVGERVVKAKKWPQNARALSGRLTRAATFLRKIGIKIERDKEGHKNNRIIEIGHILSEGEESVGNFASAPSANPIKPIKPIKPNNDNGLDADANADGMRTQTENADANCPHSPPRQRKYFEHTNKTLDAHLSKHRP